MLKHIAASSIRSGVAGIAARSADRSVVIVGPHVDHPLTGRGRLVLFLGREEATAGWFSLEKNGNAQIGQLEKALRQHFSVARYHRTVIAALEDADRTWPGSRRIIGMLEHERAQALQGAA